MHTYFKKLVQELSLPSSSKSEISINEFCQVLYHVLLFSDTPPKFSWLRHCARPCVLGLPACKPASPASLRATVILPSALSTIGHHHHLAVPLHLLELEVIELEGEKPKSHCLQFSIVLVN